MTAMFYRTGGLGARRFGLPLRWPSSSPQHDAHLFSGFPAPLPLCCAPFRPPLSGTSRAAVLTECTAVFEAHFDKLETSVCFGTQLSGANAALVLSLHMWKRARDKADTAVFGGRYGASKRASDMRAGQVADAAAALVRRWDTMAETVKVIVRVAIIGKMLQHVEVGGAGACVSGRLEVPRFRWAWHSVGYGRTAWQLVEHRQACIERRSHPLVKRRHQMLGLDMGYVMTLR